MAPTGALSKCACVGAEGADGGTFARKAIQRMEVARDGLHGGGAAGARRLRGHIRKCDRVGTEGATGAPLPEFKPRGHIS